MTRRSTPSQASTAPPAAGAVRRHIPGLDGIRAIAAGLVLVYHFWAVNKVTFPEPVQLVVTTGWVGVDIFFVISGFILFLPWARGAFTGTPVQPRRFLRNRVLRIMPAFWFNTLVLVGVAHTSLLLTFDGWKHLLAYGTFLAGYAPPSISRNLLLNQVTWTLTIEMTFYLLLPLIARFFTRNRWMWALPVTVLGSTLFKLVAIDRYEETIGALHVALSSIFGTLNQFAVGMAVAAIWARWEHRGVRLPSGLGLAGTLIGALGVWGSLWIIQYGVGLQSYLYGSGPFGWIPLLAVRPALAVFVGLALLSICYQANVVTRVLALRPIAYLGVVSYGIYLWHLPVSQWLWQGMSPEWSPWHKAFLLFTVGTGLTIVWAAVSHRFIEKPFLQRKVVPEPSTPVEEPAPVPAPRPARIHQQASDPSGRTPRQETAGV